MRLTQQNIDNKENKKRTRICLCVCMVEASNDPTAHATGEKETTFPKICHTNLKYSATSIGEHSISLGKLSLPL